MNRTGVRAIFFLSWVLRISFIKKIPCFSGKKSMNQSRIDVCHVRKVICTYFGTKCILNVYLMEKFVTLNGIRFSFIIGDLLNSHIFVGT